MVLSSGERLVPTKAGGLPEQGYVVKRLFYRRVLQGETLLDEVSAQHGLYGKRQTANGKRQTANGKRSAALLAFGRMGCHQFNERRPRHDARRVPSAREILACVFAWSSGSSPARFAFCVRSQASCGPGYANHLQVFVNDCPTARFRYFSKTSAGVFRPRVFRGLATGS